MDLKLYLIFSILYILLAYISYLELQLYKLAEENKNVKDKFIYKPYKILIYLILGLLYLINYLKKIK